LAVKCVSVLIGPSHLDEVVDAFCAIGITRLTVTELLGPHKRSPYDPIPEEDEIHELTLVPWVRVEAALPDDQLHAVIETMGRSAGAGGIGAEEILVMNLERAMRIRTGETGEAAL